MEIRRIPSVLRLSAIESAWPVADRSEREGLAYVLVELASVSAVPARAGRWSGWRGVVRAWRGEDADDEAAARGALRVLFAGWDGLPAEVADLVCAIDAGRLRASAAEAVRSPGGARGVAQAALRSRDGVLAGACAEAISSADLDAAGLAERALTVLAADAAGVDERLLEAGSARGSAGSAPGARRVDVSAVVDAVDRALHGVGTHGRSGIALAWLVLAGTPRRVFLRGRWSWSERAGAAVLAKLRSSGRAVVRLRAWEWLAEPGASSAALDRLSRPASPVEHELVLRSSALVLNPRRAWALRSRGASKEGAATMCPPGWGAERLSVPARVGVGVMARAGALTPTDALMERLLADDEPLVRWSASRSAREERLVDAAFDAHAAVARSAALRLSDVGADRPERRRGPEPATRRAIERLTRSPHASVRAIASEDRERWALTPGPASVIGLRLALRGDGSAALERVKRALAQGSARERIEAASAARRAGLAATLAPALVESARDAEEAVVATVATALAWAEDAASLEFLDGLRSHADARVRSNAVQSIARREARSGAAPSVVGHLDDPHHRVCATAARALIEGKPGAWADRAGEALAAMLGDARPERRLAGVWAADRVLAGRPGGALAERLAAGVSGLAASDVEPKVRLRAESSVRRYAAGLRSAWSRAPEGVEA